MGSVPAFCHLGPQERLDARQPQDLGRRIRHGSALGGLLYCRWMVDMRRLQRPHVWAQSTECGLMDMMLPGRGHEEQAVWRSSQMPISPADTHRGFGPAAEARAVWRRAFRGRNLAPAAAAISPSSDQAASTRCGTPECWKKKSSSSIPCEQYWKREPRFRLPMFAVRRYLRPRTTGFLGSARAGRCRFHRPRSRQIAASRSSGGNRAAQEEAAVSTIVANQAGSSSRDSITGNSQPCAELQHVSIANSRFANSLSASCSSARGKIMPA